MTFPRYHPGIATPEIIKAPTKKPRMLLRRMRLWAAGIKADLDVPTERLGEGEEALTVHPDAIRPGGVVYSFGMGVQVTWDLAMVERFGATVHVFDPAPECVDWAREQSWPERMVFHPIGLGPTDGTMRFYPPPTDRTYNWSLVNRSGAREEDAIDVPVKTLETIAGELGHERIEVLKLDIEGGEFAALPGILASDLDIPQILLEVHHHYRHLSFDDTRKALAALRDHGYRIFDIAPRCREIGLLKV